MAADGVDIELGLQNGSKMAINEHSSERLEDAPQPRVVRTGQVLHVVEVDPLLYIGKGASAVFTVSELTCVIQPISLYQKW